MYKLNLEKTEEPVIKLSKFIESQKKQENSRKTSTEASQTTLNKAFNSVDHNKLWKILKEMGITYLLLTNLYVDQEAS